MGSPLLSKRVARVMGTSRFLEKSYERRAEIARIVDKASKFDDLPEDLRFDIIEAEKAIDTERVLPGFSRLK